MQMSKYENVHQNHSLCLKELKRNKSGNNNQQRSIAAAATAAKDRF